MDLFDALSGSTEGIERFGVVEYVVGEELSRFWILLWFRFFFTLVSEVAPIIRFVPCASCGVIVVVIVSDGGVLNQVESFVVPFGFGRLRTRTSENFPESSAISSGVGIVASSSRFRVVGCSPWIVLDGTVFWFVGVVIDSPTATIATVSPSCPWHVDTVSDISLVPCG